MNDDNLKSVLSTNFNQSFVPVFVDPKKQSRLLPADKVDPATPKIG